ncbi:hypothetical protein AVEN_207375-1 [Araneus ventricosus]|uniref:Uncharacterized protein n=1 Tax=Araneus ventricosus TaxID=182803 RepID=A0A4Y2PW32_ARAVE|nr:hypothetical protein AVEN_207375-1 [Araneus ventricosus]
MITLIRLAFRLALSIRDRPIRPFKQKTIAVRNVRMSFRNFHPLSLSEIDFTPAEHAFFLRVSRPNLFGEEGCFLKIRTMPAVIAVSEEESEFSLSLIDELGRTRILMSLYFNGHRNQRVEM